MFLVAGIQNTHFKVGQYTWRLGNGERCPEKTQPGLNRHVVAVIDGLFIHYDIHNGSLFKYPLQYLVGDRQEEKKYLVRVKKVYGVKPKFQEDWIHRLRHVTHVTLNIGCICVGKKSCILSRWKEHCSNQWPRLECGGQWDVNNNSSKFTESDSYIWKSPTTIKNKNFRRKQNKTKQYMTYHNIKREAEQGEG